MAHPEAMPTLIKTLYICFHPMDVGALICWGFSQPLDVPPKWIMDERCLAEPPISHVTSPV